MPQYLAPGVYVEEVRSAARPIAGVGTSTAGFVGVVADDVTMPLRPGRPLNPGKVTREDHYAAAPAGTPQLVTSWEGFRTTFGDIQAKNSTLAHAVYGFFNNGGTRCWLVRVAPGEDAAGTDGSLIKGLNALGPIDEVAIVAIPGATSDAVQTALVDHCEGTFAQDRFALLDGRQTGEATLTKKDIQGGVRASTYAALYFPWVTVHDPATDAPLAVPPSGHIAGVYARVDAERGVHKAPANEVIRGALGVERLLGRADQAGLNPIGINVIRGFGGDVTVYGARTLGGDANSDFKYVNVRRLFLFLRESIGEGTGWVVFEPNEPALWAKISRNVTAFLTTVWRAGALFGATAAEAFYVKCDAETNPPEVRELGQVVTEVGVAAVQPAEFVIFRITQSAAAEGSR
jgi:uncharacterized protein